MVEPGAFVIDRCSICPRAGDAKSNETAAQTAYVREKVFII
jgi:hypothetical protein